MLKIARFVVTSLIFLSASATTFAQTEPPSVRVIYLVSADREVNEDYKAAIRMAILDIQKWYKKQMNGRTFRLNEPIVEVLKSNQNANWFTGSPIEGIHEGDWGITHTRSEVRRLLPNEQIPGNYTWVLYSDGPGKAGRGGGQVCYMPEDDLLGLTGRHPTQRDIPRWIAGLGHEIGHAFGLPHPEDTETYENAIMWLGIYGHYPDGTYLTPDDKALLEKSPFFMTDEEFASDQPEWQTVYSYSGGSFVRFRTVGGNHYWIENTNDGSTFRFEETSRDTAFYYAFGRSVVTLKIPIEGGLSYYSNDDGKNWNTNHAVSITADESIGETLDATADSTSATSATKPSEDTSLQDCKPLDQLATVGPNLATDIAFTNQRNEKVTLFWINYEQQKVEYLTLNPGQRAVQPTYTNHWWMAQSSITGKCLGVYKSDEVPPVIVNIE